MDFDKATIVRRQLGLDELAVSSAGDFDDPDFSRQVLGLQVEKDWRLSLGNCAGSAEARLEHQGRQGKGESTKVLRP